MSAPTMTDVPERATQQPTYAAGFRPGLWTWIFVVVGSLALALLVGVAWLHSDTDLQRVKAKARAMGIAPTWAEAVYAVRTPDEIAACEMMREMTTRWKSQSEVDLQKMPRLGEPIAGPIRETAGRVPEERWANIDELMNRLPDEAGVEPAYWEDANRRSEDINQTRAFQRLCLDRMLVAPADSLVTACVSASRAITLLGSDSMIEQLVQISCAAIWQRALSHRLADIQKSGHLHTVIHAVQRVRTTIGRQQRTYGGELRQMCHLFENPALLHETLAAWAAMSGPTATTWWSPLREVVKPTCLRIQYRINREETLMQLVRWASAAQRDQNPQTLISALNAYAYPQIRWEWLSVISGKSGSMGLSSMIAVSAAKCDLNLQVLEHCLRGLPTPPDPFSPTQAPLIEVRRAGTLLGWYSVGIDGMDGGGRPVKDIAIEIYGKFGQPKFSDPLSPRP